MTQSEFTELVKVIFSNAKQGLPVAIKSRLVCDESCTADKWEKRFDQQALKFCIWSSPTAGFWDRNYGSYHVVYDPYKDLSDAIFQVRFMFFVARKQTGNGKFNADVLRELKLLNGIRDFKVASGPKHIVFQKSYYVPCQTQDWQKEATEDLSWMISKTWPKFEAITNIAPLS